MVFTLACTVVYIRIRAQYDTIYGPLYGMSDGVEHIVTLDYDELLTEIETWGVPHTGIRVRSISYVCTCEKLFLSSRFV